MRKHTLESKKFFAKRNGEEERGRKAMGLGMATKSRFGGVGEKDVIVRANRVSDSLEQGAPCHYFI